MPAYNVLDFGATGDGQTNDAGAIQKAIDACSSSGGGRVYLPAGKTYRAGWIELKSNVDLHLERGAVLLASPDYSDFENPKILLENKRLQDLRFMYTSERDFPFAFIAAHDAENISISGGGTIDGNGRAYILTKLPHIYRMPAERPWTMFLIGVNNLTIQDVLIRDGALWTLRLSGCSDVVIHGIRMLNDLKLPNSDGIDLDCCQNVRISDCSIQAGDDAICVKTTPGFERYGISENITVTGCNLVSTSSALVLGCEVRQTIRNVIFEACVIQSSHRGMSINLSQAGSVENVLFSNIIVETRIFHDDWWGCGEPIYIKASPWTDMDTCGQIRNIRFSNILAHSENGVLVYGWKPGLIDQILFENVHLQLDKWSKWKGGKLDLRPNPGAHNGYNQGVIEHPTSAFMLYNAGSITLRNCQVSWMNKPSYFHHAVQYAQVKDLRLEHFNGEAADPDRYAAIEQSW